MKRSEAKSLLAQKLDTNLTDITAGLNDLWTESDLNELIQTGVQLAWDFERWNFTEKTLTTTWASADAAAGYFNYPNNFEGESIDRIRVAAKEWTKIDFDDFNRYLENYPTGDQKFWAEHERRIFLNPNAVSVGDAVDLPGKLFPPALSTDSDILPFSPEFDDQESSGNRAIVELAYAEALDSEKKKDNAKAELTRKRAYSWLTTLAAPIAARRSKAQHNDRPFFADVPDFLGKSTGRSTNIGNFP